MKPVEFCSREWCNGLYDTSGNCAKSPTKKKRETTKLYSKVYYSFDATSFQPI